MLGSSNASRKQTSPFVYIYYLRLNSLVCLANLHLFTFDSHAVGNLCSKPKNISKKKLCSKPKNMSKKN